jgi:hypothetical protein
LYRWFPSVLKAMTIMRPETGGWSLQGEEKAMVGMRRRELLGLLGGAVAAWPSVARAQQPIIPLFGVILVFSREAGRTFRAAANHQISTSLTKAGDFRGPALPSPSWW